MILGTKVKEKEWLERQKREGEEETARVGEREGGVQE